MMQMLEDQMLPMIRNIGLNQCGVSERSAKICEHCSSGFTLPYRGDTAFYRLRRTFIVRAKSKPSLLLSRTCLQCLEKPHIAIIHNSAITPALSGVRGFITVSCWCLSCLYGDQNRLAAKLLVWLSSTLQFRLLTALYIYCLVLRTYASNSRLRLSCIFVKETLK